MKSVLHTAESRGHAYFGWLDSHHSFSFGQYHDPNRMNFGALRVLNDDWVAGAKGFGFHPHNNMEIVSIPLEGELEHKDNMGSDAIIRSGDVQIMSAGTGIVHSEYNKNNDSPVKFLQIWVIPSKKNVVPRYQQITLAPLKENTLTQIVTPDQAGPGVWLHQDAWFHLGNYQQNQSMRYSIHKAGNGTYVFVLNGSVVINGQVLNTRDALGVWDTDQFEIKSTGTSSFLIMEVPMDI